MSDIWTPSGAIPFDDDVERVIAESDDPAEARRLAEQLRAQGLEFATDENFGSALEGPDSAVILLPRAWGWMPLKDGRRVPCATVNSKALERMILDATAEVEYSGITTTAENEMVAALCPALVIRFRQFHALTPLEYPEMPYPGDWRTDMRDGFALAVPNPDPTDSRTPYIATSPMSPVDGLVVHAESRKYGRNEKCPCGSGIKYKRCCGR